MCHGNNKSDKNSTGGHQMRIMIINTYYYPEIMGGAEYSVKKLAEALTISGNDVLVVSTGDKDSKETVNGVNIWRVKPHNVCRAIHIDSCSRAKKALHRIEDLWNIRNLTTINKILDEFKPEVVHTNGLYDITPVIWKAAKKRNISVVHTIRDYYLMCPRVAMACKKTKGKKCTNPMIFCRLHRGLNRFHSKYVDVVTAPSSITLNVLIDAGFFARSKKHVVPNATDFDQHKVASILKAKRRKENGIVSFVYLGTLSEQKGIKWMIDSFNKLKKGTAKLYIAGKGDLEEYVKIEVKKNDNIKFLGFLNEKKVSELLKKMDVLLCPSLWDEPLGRVVLDAYKHAMPVICSNMGALPELVKDGKTGYVVDARDQDKMVAKMEHYITFPEDILNHADSGVKELQHYTIEHQLTLFEQSYRQDI